MKKINLKRKESARRGKINQTVFYVNESGEFVAMDNTGKETIVANTKIKRYKALLSQTGTDDPTEKVLENTLSDDVALARSGAGVYTITLAGEFTADKTAIKIAGSEIAGAPVIISAVRTSADVITVSVVDNAGTPADAGLTDTLIEVEVYPA